MNLDKRIKKGKTYLDCFDIKKAKNFIGRECYVSDDVTSFANVDNLRKAVLKEVDEGSVNPYTLENTRWKYSSNFILPCEWVKEPEKRYRPYTLNEFVNQYSLGDEVIVRLKGKEIISHKLFVEYDENDDTDMVRLSFIWYGLVELYDSFEIYTSEGWKPFGIEE